MAYALCLLIIFGLLWVHYWSSAKYNYWLINSRIFLLLSLSKKVKPTDIRRANATSRKKEDLSWQPLHFSMCGKLTCFLFLYLSPFLTFSVMQGGGIFRLLSPACANSILFSSPLCTKRVQNVGKILQICLSYPQLLATAFERARFQGHSEFPSFFNSAKTSEHDDSSTMCFRWCGQQQQHFRRHQWCCNNVRLSRCQQCPEFFSGQRYAHYSCRGRQQQCKFFSGR